MKLGAESAAGCPADEYTARFFECSTSSGFTYRRTGRKLKPQIRVNLNKELCRAVDEVGWSWAARGICGE